MGPGPAARPGQGPPAACPGPTGRPRTAPRWCGPSSRCSWCAGCPTAAAPPAPAARATYITRGVFGKGRTDGLKPLQGLTNEHAANAQLWNPLFCSHNAHVSFHHVFNPCRIQTGTLQKPTGLRYVTAQASQRNTSPMTRVHDKCAPHAIIL